MKKGKGKGLKKVIINSIVLILLIVGLGFACVPLFKDLKFGLDLQGGFEILYKVESIARNNLKMAAKDEVLIIINQPSEETKEVTKLPDNGFVRFLETFASKFNKDISSEKAAD